MSRNRSNSARKRKVSAGVSPVFLWVQIGIVAVFLPCIFLLPYHVPLSAESPSQSWEFGFNNTVAQAAIALMLLALFAWQYLSGPKSLEGDPVAQSVIARDEPVRLRSLLMVMVSFQLLTFAVLIIWYTVLPMTHYGEFTYFTQRVEAAIMGRAPYADFAFDYGPAMLSIPVALYHCFGGAISEEQAYFATLVLHYLIGLALVAYVISQINGRARLLVMAFVAFQWINLTMGLQYTPLRFIIAMASLCAVRHIHRAFDGGKRIALLAAAGALFPLLSFSISPEMGLALTIALLVYFGWCFFGPDRRLSALVVSVLAGLGISMLIFSPAYFASILSFGKGAASFPIFPTAQILGFLAAAVWVFPKLGVLALRDKSGGAPFCAALAFLLGLLILPATGRCDPGHVWINSMGLFIVALAAASWLRPAAWYTLCGVYVLIFPISVQISIWDHYQQPIMGVLETRAQLANVVYDPDNYDHLAPGAPRPRIHYSKLLPMGGELEQLPKVKIGLPLGDDEALERYLKLNYRDIPTYHIAPYSDIFGPADEQQVFKEFQSMDYIFVASYYLNYLRPFDPQYRMRAQGEGDDRFLSGLLLFPVDLTPVHPMFIPDMDIMRRIAQEYGLVKQYSNGVLLKRK
ncbi:MAG TPA: hypothetical protein VHY22_09845 [Chthoniobacteraceae bacterium]|jgi:hypothetical protein|nr:hypothetical protein [Chthoniobacteraceae bacterium]